MVYECNSSWQPAQDAHTCLMCEDYFTKEQLQKALARGQSSTTRSMHGVPARRVTRAAAGRGGARGSREGPRARKAAVEGVKGGRAPAGKGTRGGKGGGAGTAKRTRGSGAA